MVFRKSMGFFSEKYYVVHLIPFFESFQGYEEDILSRYQANEGHKVIVISSFLLPSKEGRSLLERLKFEFFSISENRIIIRLPCILLPSKLTFLLGASILLIILNYDFIHLHGLLNPLGAIYAGVARLRGKTVISDNHDFIYNTHQLAQSKRFFSLIKKLEFIIFRRIIGSVQLFLSNYVIAYEKKCTQFLRNFYKYDGNIIQSRIGFEDNLFSPEIEKNSNEFVDLGFIGQISRRKKPELLLEILSLLPSNHRLIIIGSWDKTLLKEFRKKTKIMQLNKRVRILGNIKYKELGKYCNNLDLGIYLNSSSISCQQILGCGVPILVDKNQQFSQSASLYGEKISFVNEQEMIEKTVCWIKNDLKKFPKLDKDSSIYKNILEELSFRNTYWQVKNNAYKIKK